MISALCAIIGFLFYVRGASLPVFILGEIFLALSITFWSGAYEALALDVCQMGDNRESVARFFHDNLAIVQTAVVFSGLIAGFAIGRSNNYSLAYFLAIGSMAAVVGLILLLPNESRRTPTAALQSKNPLRPLARSSLGYAFLNSEIGALVKLMVIMQFLAQPVLHYWQPFIQTVCGFEPAQLSFLFSGFCLAAAIVNYYGKKFRSLKANIVLLSWALLITIMGFEKTTSSVVILMCLVQAAYAFGKAMVGGHLAYLAPSDQRASVLSAAWLVSRTGMLASLGLSGALLAGLPNGKGSSYSHFYLIYGVLGLALFTAATLHRAHQRSTKVRKARVCS